MEDIFTYTLVRKEMITKLKLTPPFFRHCGVSVLKPLPFYHAYRCDNVSWAIQLFLYIQVHNYRGYGSREIMLASPVYRKKM